ncbi:MAG TPA: hypothetical protein VMW87_11965, partial [Spirochaetia bacterium]|nr:hypothetical protein [Spirochaetia bacterium]
EEWLPSGFTEHDRHVLVYGPYLEGVTLDETLTREPAAILGLLERLTAAVALLQERRLPLHKLHTRGVVFLNDGGTLLLPGELMRTIREYQPLDDQIRYFESMNHPDLDPTQNLSYFLASMVYRAVTGQYPYRAERSEDLHLRVRAGYSIDPVYHDPRIREDLSNFVIEILRDPLNHLHEPSEWIARLRDWATAGPFQEVTEQGKAVLLQQAEARWKRMTKRFKRREFVRKHGKVTVLIAAMVLVVGTIPGTIISKALAPRTTHGYPPEKVVFTFYNGMNNLDQAVMQECVIDGAGKNEINQVVNLYVTSRMRMSVEMKSGVLPAQGWVDSGKPALKPTTFVFGVSGLKMKLVDQSALEVVIAATYLKWQPEFPQSASTDSSAKSVIKNTAYQRNDILHLKRDRGDWVIYRIDRKEDAIVPSLTVFTPAA